MNAIRSPEPPDCARALSSLLDAQRQAHQADPYPDHSARAQRLQRLQRLLANHAQAFADAISADFGHRSQHETRMAEMLTLQVQVAYALRHLKSWMRVRRMPTALAWWPARNTLMFQPLGVVGIVAPWNYPLQLALSPAIDALAAGNRVMIKPSEHTPRLATELQLAVAKYFAANEISVVVGNIDTARAFVQLPFDHLLFTGSEATGREVAQTAAAQLVPVTLELGGKSPALIDVSAHMAHAAARIAVGKLLNAGQTCVAPDYALVHRSQQETFVEHYSRAVRAMYPDIGPNPDYSSIINAQHFNRLLELLQQAHAQGARIVPLGDTDMAARKLAPCIVLQASEDGALMREEIFGPILPVVLYDNLSQAIESINARPRPLALYWFGRDAHAQREVLQHTLCGGVAINDCLYHLAQTAQPFGGTGASGMGAYHGPWGFRSFSHAKPVFIQSRISSTRWLRPPYGSRFDHLLALARKLG